MPLVRRILGNVSVEVAKGKRKCQGNPAQHVIRKGEPCLVIAEPSYQGTKNYRKRCARDILDQAQADLDRFEAELFDGTRT